MSTDDATKAARKAERKARQAAFRARQDAARYLAPPHGRIRLADLARKRAAGL